MLLGALALACLQSAVAHHRCGSGPLEGAVLLGGPRSNSTSVQGVLHLVGCLNGYGRQALLQAVAGGVGVGISGRIRFGVVALRQAVDVSGQTWQVKVWEEGSGLIYFPISGVICNSRAECRMLGEGSG